VKTIEEIKAARRRLYHRDPEELCMGIECPSNIVDDAIDELEDLRERVAKAHDATRNGWLSDALDALEGK
jgi:hypothetical protein